jgi:hypothetical protein
MPHFWLCYRDPKQRFNVTIIEARSLIHARLKATLAGQNGGMVFAEGHELGPEMAQLVQASRVLSADQAMELLTQLGPKPRETKE